MRHLIANSLARIKYRNVVFKCLCFFGAAGYSRLHYSRLLSICLFPGDFHLSSPAPTSRKPSIDMTSAIAASVCSGIVRRMPGGGLEIPDFHARWRPGGRILNMWPVTVAFAPQPAIDSTREAKIAEFAPSVWRLARRWATSPCAGAAMVEAPLHVCCLRPLGFLLLRCWELACGSAVPDAYSVHVHLLLVGRWD